MRKDYMSSYGYPINSTPFLATTPGILVNGYLSTASHTAVSLPRTLAISHGLDLHPELKMAMDKIEMQKSALKLTDSKYKPKVYIGADGSYSSPGYNFHKDLDPNYAVYAKVSVPIFEWGKRKNEKRISKQKIAMAEDAMYKTNDNILLSIEQARSSLSQAIERAKLSEASLEKANENERMSVEKYSEGKISIVEVLNAQVYKQTSQINFVQAKLATQNEYASLVKALNKYDSQ
jgi:outer membrane protein TolC